MALVVTPEGFPLAYEMLPGNTSDRTTLEAFLEKIGALYGKAERIWMMDRGIPTQESWKRCGQRSADPLFGGHTRARLGAIGAAINWSGPGGRCAEGVQVKLLPQAKSFTCWHKVRIA